MTAMPDMGPCLCRSAAASQARTIPTATPQDRQHLPRVSRSLASVQTLQGPASHRQEGEHIHVFLHFTVSLLQGEASLWVKHKPQQYWPCIQSTHWSNETMGPRRGHLFQKSYKQ